jgi:septum formation protein
VLVLASASPRRAELIRRLDLEGGGLALRIRPADIDESPAAGEPCADYVARMARTKARAVREGDALVLAADTIVALDGTILAKPADAAENAAMIERLGGRSHRVTTAVALARDGELLEDFAVGTTVRFRELAPGDAERYAATGEGLDKAGGYGIQGLGAALVAAIEGSYTNVVGLPLAETLALLRRWEALP